jgi:hypothetical protein
MWPITATCGLLARAGAVRVRIANGRPSHAERRVGDSVEISRLALFSIDVNSGSITSSRWSLLPESWLVGSRTAQISPSPLERPVMIRGSIDGSMSARSRRTWSQDGTLPRAAAIAGQQHEPVGVMTGRFDLEVGAAADGGTERDQQLGEDRDRVSLCVRCDQLDDLAVCSW